MGLTYANIELVNAGDISAFKRGYIGENEIRQITVKMKVERKSVMLCINKSMQQVLSLPFCYKRYLQLGNEGIIQLDVVGPVIVRYLDRDSMTNAILLPDDQEPLLGAIPMEEMDLYVNPSRNELLPVHPEGPLMSLK